MQERAPPYGGESSDDIVVNRAYRAKTIAMEEELMNSNHQGLDLPGSIANQPLHHPPDRTVSLVSSNNLAFKQMSNPQLAVDWEQISIGEEDMKLFEGMMEDKTGTVRQNKKVVKALNQLSESMVIVQDELNLQKNLAKLEQMKNGEGSSKRRSKLYYGKDSAENHHQRFVVLRNILTFMSCAPPLILIVIALAKNDSRYYRLAVALWPIEALFVLLHFVITIERSTREPNPEEKVHFVLHFVCHWSSIIIYLVLNPHITAIWPVVGMALLTSTPLYFMLKQVRAAVQQYHILQNDIGDYVDEVFVLLLGVLVPQLYLWFETWSSYSGEDEGTSSHNGVGFNGNLCISLLLLELGLFDIAVLGTGVSCIRDLMTFAIPPFLQASQWLIAFASMVALYFQGSKESEDDMPSTLRQALWYVFALASMGACMILAIKLPLKEIIAKRRRKLSVTGRTTREKAHDVGPEKVAGQSSLPKFFGVEVSPYDREISAQRKAANKEIEEEAKMREARRLKEKGRGGSKEDSLRSAQFLSDSMR
ncbi:hypothetical protein TrRE_jg6613 [Triparma retinervis]|uniref:Transmembrane protein n=1 Tax=Triparma retinervis TaxID=2557542 RepID=A0A9W7FH09_9STRA|nr:hypothetical protein TrRE_jg6613 [Triparma retinervis]